MGVNVPQDGSRYRTIQDGRNPACQIGAQVVKACIPKLFFAVSPKGRPGHTLQMDMGIDQPRHDRCPGSVEYGDIVGPGLGADLLYPPMTD
jgi:hypothetical protein